FDFCERVDLNRVNKRVVEALIRAGAFDSLHADRATLMASVERAMSHAQSAAASAGQSGLFDSADAAASVAPQLTPARTWTLREQLAQEKTAIGFYLSGHLFDEVAAEMQRLTGRRIGTLQEAREPVMVAGVVTACRFQKGMRGLMAILTLDDKSGAIEAVAYSELVTERRDLLKEDELLVVRGKVQFDKFSNGLRINIDDCWSLEGARRRFGKAISLRVNGTAPVDDVVQVIRRHHATDGLPLVIDVERNGAASRVELGERARVVPSDDAIRMLRALALGDSVQVLFQ
ncbi:MAG: DNA polymerase III subunit alpha, partial [Betaproteobacteria bacterium]|nr:DNA polymerase III subunit alpha [Betaproteobacteria bacterium]